MEKLHPRSLWIFFLRFIFWWLFLIISLGFVTLPFWLEPLIEKGFSLLPFVVLLSLIVIGLPFCYVWARLTYNSWRYEVGEDVLKIECGVLRKRYVSIPYEKIQNIDIHRGVMARILGLSELRVQTAGYGGARGQWGFWAEGCLPGIDQELAKRLKDRLIAKVKEAKSEL